MTSEQNSGSQGHVQISDSHTCVELGHGLAGVLAVDYPTSLGTVANLDAVDFAPLDGLAERPDGRVRTALGALRHQAQVPLVRVGGEVGEACRRAVDLVHVRPGQCPAVERRVVLSPPRVRIERRRLRVERRVAPERMCVTRLTCATTNTVETDCEPRNARWSQGTSAG